MFDKDTNSFIYYICYHIKWSEYGYWMKMFTTKHTTYEKAKAEGEKWNGYSEDNDYEITDEEIKFND